MNDPMARSFNTFKHISSQASSFVAIIEAGVCGCHYINTSSVAFDICLIFFSFEQLDFEAKGHTRSTSYPGHNDQSDILMPVNMRRENHTSEGKNMIAKGELRYQLISLEP